MSYQAWSKVSSESRMQVIASAIERIRPELYTLATVPCCKECGCKPVGGWSLSHDGSVTCIDMRACYQNQR